MRCQSSPKDRTSRVSRSRTSRSAPRTSPVGDPRLKPATLASLTVGPSGSAGTPPFVPNSAYARKANAVNRTNQQYLSSPAAATSLQWRSVTRDATGLVIVNNVLKVSNNGTAGKQPGAVAGSITLKGITFPGSVPPRVLSAKPIVTAKAAAVRGRPAAYGSTAPQTVRINAATNSGTLSGNQFLDGGTGDIGLQWRDVTVNGSVRIEHNSCSINVVGDANNTGPITVSGIRFDTGWSASGAATDTLLLTPAAGVAQTAAATPSGDRRGRHQHGEQLGDAHGRPVSRRRHGTDRPPVAACDDQLPDPHRQQRVLRHRIGHQHARRLGSGRDLRLTPRGHMQRLWQPPSR
jgi:hypothetical protein